MSIISRITVQKKNQSRYNIFFEKGQSIERDIRL